MIQLTRLNNTPLTVNSDLIKFVEQSPDTVITLVGGEKIVVRENASQVVERILGFRRAVLEGIYPATGHFATLSMAAACQGTQAAEPDEG
jgi:flagellar protein FlbD